MGLGETQVFQDEKSRLANTTVARIVAAKGSLNDPETMTYLVESPENADVEMTVIVPAGVGAGSAS